MDQQVPARERADIGAEGTEGAAAALLRRAQDVADQLRREAVEEAERATAESRRLRDEAQQHHDEARAAAERDRDNAARRLADASGEAQTIEADASEQAGLLVQS